MNKIINKAIDHLPSVVINTGITFSFVMYWCSVSGSLLWGAKLFVLLSPVIWTALKYMAYSIVYNMYRREKQKQIMIRSRVRREF